MLPGCCDAWNDKAVRAGRGAAWALAPLAFGARWDEIQYVIKKHRLRLIAADARGTDIREVISNASGESSGHNQEGGWCLVLGSEGQGLSAATRAQPGLSLVSIAMENSVESLNVACAGSILMHAVRCGDSEAR